MSQEALILLVLVCYAQASTGKGGTEWNADLVKVVYAKLYNLFSDPIPHIKPFDLNKGLYDLNDGKGRNVPDYSKYVYDFDPEFNLTRPNCDHHQQGSQCREAWVEDRDEDIALTPRKLLRLAFHDCAPYQNGGGGCDGCINFDANIEENHGLQYTVAVLEKLYLEPDYPENAPNLDSSLKDLGVSRADLWAFASLVSLDEFWQSTRGQCNLHQKEATCEEFECFVPPLDNVKKLFKTGRKDCKPKSGTGPFQTYLTAEVEEHPNQNGNGQMTFDYFDQHFKMGKRESLALLGIHSIGQFNGISSKLNYGWNNGLMIRMNMFNNEYFRILAEKPAYKPVTLNLTLDDGTRSRPRICSGNMDNEPAEHYFQVRGTDFSEDWAPEIPWASKDRIGRLQWFSHYKLAPTCLEKGEVEKDDDDEDSEDVANDQWDDARCCQEMKKKNGCSDQDLCREKCLRLVSNRARYTSSEIGYYYNFKFKNGMPKGCKIFKKEHDEKWYREHRSIMEGVQNTHGCEKQRAKDETGKPIYKAVELYAEKPEKWMKDFVNAFDKMQQNGYNKNELKGSVNNLWTHRCCIQTGINLMGGDKAEFYKQKFFDAVEGTGNVEAKSALACQSFCQNEPECGSFMYRTQNGKGSKAACKLRKTTDYLKNDDDTPADYFQRDIQNAHKFIVGPKQCPEELSDCDMFDISFNVAA